MQAKSPLPYVFVLSLPFCVGVAFTFREGFVWLPMFYAFAIVPLLEVFFKPNHQNLSPGEEQSVKQNKWFDYIIYSMVPLQYGLLFWLLYEAKDFEWTVEWLGMTLSMGLLCGSIGINVGHELGHRRKGFEKRLGQMLLLSSLYLHFNIEHNKGHHVRVATPEDPATARRGEWLYVFWFRSMIYGYINAWNLEFKRLKGKWFSWKNQMIQFTAVSLLFLLVIAAFNTNALVAFILAAFFGMILLETINYIEHYGLMRSKMTNGHYEPVRPKHSWNSDHIVGRLLLFELSRHSDHHHLPARKYQVLRYRDEAPQLPTGYPGMMLLSVFPPLFFAIMHKHLP